MKKAYISPLTEIIYINSEELLELDWHSTVLSGDLPGGDNINPGGDGEEDDTQLIKKNAWSDSEGYKNIWGDD